MGVNCWLPARISWICAGPRRRLQSAPGGGARGAATGEPSADPRKTRAERQKLLFISSLLLRAAGSPLTL
eukprot:6827578-Pyramimonas_sp.AAC.1